MSDRQSAENDVPPNTEIEALADVFSNCEPDESEQGLARAVLTSDWLRERLAEAWERGHFYCAAEAGDDRCDNPYDLLTSPGETSVIPPATTEGGDA